MAKLGINTGTAPDAGDGDSLFNGAIKINSNFDEIYNAIGDGTNITNQIGYASISGISTYASTSGVSTYSVTSGVSTYSVISGYSTTSGISTLSQGLTGTPNVTVGVLTASSYYGNAVNLSGIITSIIQGSNVTISQSGGSVTISAATTSPQIETYWLPSTLGIHTLSYVGIGTTDPTSELYITGNAYISGIITASNFSGNVEYSQLSGISTYSSISGVSTYSEVAGISTYAISSGVSTDVLGGIASITQLNVSGISTFDNVYGSEFINPDYGKIRISRDGGINVGRIGFHSVSDTLVSAIQSNLENGSLEIYNNTNTSSNITLTAGGSVRLNHGGNNTKLSTLDSGVSVTGTTFTDQLSVSGVSTFSSNVGIGTTNPTDTLTVRGGDISVGINTSQGLILTSPNGTKYRLIVANDGALSTVAV